MPGDWAAGAGTAFQTGGFVAAKPAEPMVGFSNTDRHNNAVRLVEFRYQLTAAQGVTAQSKCHPDRNAFVAENSFAKAKQQSLIFTLTQGGFRSP